MKIETDNAEKLISDNKFFWSDPHFGHHKIAPTRGFAITEEMDQFQIDAINDVVGKGDILYLLGDVGIDKDPKFLEDIIKNRIICKYIRLIVGNHDRPERIGYMFDQVHDTAMVKLCGNQTWLSHYPHLYWPASHYGSLHLFGHMHNNRTKTINELFPQMRSMDIGVDATMALQAPHPWPSAKIVEKLMKREGHDNIKFYKGLRKVG